MLSGLYPMHSLGVVTLLGQEMFFHLLCSARDSSTTTPWLEVLTGRAQTSCWWSHCCPLTQPPTGSAAAHCPPRESRNSQKSIGRLPSYLFCLQRRHCLQTPGGPEAIHGLQGCTQSLDQRMPEVMREQTAFSPPQKPASHTQMPPRHFLLHFFLSCRCTWVSCEANLFLYLAPLPRPQGGPQREGTPRGKPALLGPTPCHTAPGPHPHLMPMECVEQPAFHEVHDLQGRVTGGGDQVVSRGVEREGVHCRTVHWRRDTSQMPPRRPGTTAEA